MLNGWDIIRRTAQFCGDCGRKFDDCEGDHCYVRIGPARLICLDCKLKEPPRESTTTPPKSVAEKP
jgi:hypothetical protein